MLKPIKDKENLLLVDLGHDFGELVIDLLHKASGVSADRSSLALLYVLSELVIELEELSDFEYALRVLFLP